MYVCFCFVVIFFFSAVFMGPLVAQAELLRFPLTHGLTQVQKILSLRETCNTTLSTSTEIGFDGPYFLLGFGQ